MIDRGSDQGLIYNRVGQNKRLFHHKARTESALSCRSFIDNNRVKWAIIGRVVITVLTSVVSSDYNAVICHVLSYRRIVVCAVMNRASSGDRCIIVGWTAFSRSIIRATTATVLPDLIVSSMAAFEARNTCFSVPNAAAAILRNSMQCRQQV